MTKKKRVEKTSLSHLCKPTGIFLLCVFLNAHEMAAETTRVQYLMGTLCEITAEDQPESHTNQALSAAFEEIARLEQVMSTYKNDSEVTRIQQKADKAPYPCSNDMISVLASAQSFAIRTQGAFDVTVGPLLRFWNAAETTSPSPQVFQGILKVVGYRHLIVDPVQKTVFFKKPGMSLDFGGIGKGFAMDQAAHVLTKNGIQKGLINFGGQILVINNSTPEKDQRVEIKDPSNPQKTLVPLTLSHGSVSTSSQSERFREINGKRVGHIIDPRNGYPVSFEGSVTAVAPTATEADALSTALLVMGPEKGISFIETEAKDCAALFIFREKDQWIKRSTASFAHYLAHRPKNERLTSLASQKKGTP